MNAITIIILIALAVVGFVFIPMLRKPRLSGAAIHAKSRGIFVDIYPEGNNWRFKYTDETGARGEIKPAVPTLGDAVYLLRQWRNSLPSRAKLSIQWQVAPPKGYENESPLSI
jgi:hypothetical protein